MQLKRINNVFTIDQSINKHFSDLVYTNRSRPYIFQEVYFHKSSSTEALFPKGIQELEWTFQDYHQSQNTKICIEYNYGLWKF